MFTLEAAPKRATVCGGGAVGLEFAQWLARMGTAVTLVIRSQLFHSWDVELGKELIRALSDEMTVLCPAAIQGLEDGHMTVKLGDGTEERFELGEILLNATGRLPALDGLDLAAVGLDPKDLGIDGARFQTKVPHVFIAGDATGDRAILHEANLEGEVAGRNAARVASGSSDLVTYDPDNPPLMAIFSDPPAASLGLSPQHCEAQGIAYESAIKHFPQQGRGIVVGAKYGFVRLVAEPNAGRILGCQMLGPRADDMIHIPAAVMRLGGTVAQMRNVPWYHPTLAEAFIEVTRELNGS
jgi:pyruvate/2-oxoglutarate dehydrogenase complex dihydrolipoamide dehydrogenase (E3) component